MTGIFQDASTMSISEAQITALLEDWFSAWNGEVQIAIQWSDGGCSYNVLSMFDCLGSVVSTFSPFASPNLCHDWAWYCNHLYLPRPSAWSMQEVQTNAHTHAHVWSYIYIYLLNHLPSFFRVFQNQQVIEYKTRYLEKTRWKEIWWFSSCIA